MIELTNKTLQLVTKLFQENDWLEAIDLLKCECAENLYLHDKTIVDGNERIRFAAIKLSEGNLGKLYCAVDLAQKDWRDLLMISNFEHDINDHEIWANNVLNIK